MSITIHGETYNSRPLQLSLIVGILLIAALLRITRLSSLPPGLSNEEIAAIQVAETVRVGRIASLYNVGDPSGGHEGLYPVVEAITTGLIGDGLFAYRILSVWCGLVSIALMYALTRRLFGNFAAFAAAITLTVSLWSVLLSRATIRETLLLPLMLAFLLILSKAIHLTRTISPDTPTTFLYALVGILIAALVYTHWSGIVAVPIFLLYLAYLVVMRQPISRRVLGFSGFAILMAVILGIPYLAVSLRSPSLSGIYVFWANRPRGITGFLGSALETLGSIVLIGDRAVTHNLPGSPLLGPLGGLLLLIGLVVALQHWRAPNMMFVLLVLVVGLFPDAWSRTNTNFGTMTVALPAIVVLVGFGASLVMDRIRHVPDLLRDSRTMAFATGIALICAALTGFILFGIWANHASIDRAYHGQLGRLATYLDHTKDTLTTSICTFNMGRADANNISDPALLDLMMHHENQMLRFSDCLNGFVLTGGGGLQRIAYSDPGAAKSLSPVFQPWLGHAVSINESPLVPHSVVEVNVEQQLADTLGMVTLAPVTWPPDNAGSTENAVLPVRMGGYLTFEGYTLNEPRLYKPGDTVSLVTYWRADGDQIPDLRIFAHLLRNPNTEPVLQNDTLSLDSSLLRARDIFIQVINIPLPPDFPAGEYYISVGAYSHDTGERLPVYDNDQLRGDRLFLNTVTVQP
ncbi:MAG: glycosyltransferase family 39 protein [Chloroflexota bacterium]